MRSVDEVFRPVVCPEPSLVCETQRGFFFLSPAFTLDSHSRIKKHFPIHIHCQWCAVLIILNWGHTLLCLPDLFCEFFFLFFLFSCILESTARSSRLLSLRAEVQMCFLLATQSITFHGRDKYLERDDGSKRLSIFSFSLSLCLCVDLVLMFLYADTRTTSFSSQTWTGTVCVFHLCGMSYSWH